MPPRHNSLHLPRGRIGLGGGMGMGRRQRRRLRRLQSQRCQKCSRRKLRLWRLWSQGNLLRRPHHHHDCQRPLPLLRRFGARRLSQSPQRRRRCRRWTGRRIIRPRRGQGRGLGSGEVGHILKLRLSRRLPRNLQRRCWSKCHKSQVRPPPKQLQDLSQQPLRSLQ
jgi:hypothetical protein